MTNSLFPELSKQSKKNEDERGSLEILYESNAMVLKRSFSKKGVFRGLHLQSSPHKQTKLIRVVEGEIIDFIIDPNNEKNQIHWRKIDSKNDWILIAPDFAHGFYALTDTIFEYICDGAYNEESEQSYSITDFLKKTMGINELILSEKDLNALQLPVNHAHMEM